MKTRKQHLITILLTLFLGLCSIHASAQTVTFTIKVVDYGSGTYRGNVKYKVNGGSYIGPSYNCSVTANIGDVIIVSAQSTSVYGFSHWDINVANPPATTNDFGLRIDVTEEYDGKEVVAQFTSWSAFDSATNPNIVYLENGAVYTLATSGSGTDFTVTSSEDTRYNGKVFSSIGKVEFDTEGGTATIVFNTSNLVWVMERIRVVKGTLNLVLGAGYTAASTIPTIQRDPRNATSNLILVDPPKSESDYTKCQLSIQGNSADVHFIIDGNCVMELDETNLNNIHFNKTSGTESDHALMSIGGGKVSMDYVTFTHAWNKLDNSPAGILISTFSSVTMPAKVTMTNSLIEWCYSTTYGAGITIYNETQSGSTLKMENCEVRYCNTDGTTDECGGVIRTNSGSVCALTLDNCELHHNYSIYGGGAIRWNSTDAPLQLTGCSLYNNWTGGSSAKWTGGSGGALLAESNVTVSGCTIQNNTATGKGGGIYVGGGTLTLTGTNAIHIQNNHASTDGGGIYQNGTMNINSSSFTVSGNTSDAAKTLVDNNIYLPTGKTIRVGDLGMATGLNIRVCTESDASKGDIAVLTADNASYLANIYNSLKNGAARLLDDKHKHKVKYTPAKNTMDAMTLYFALPTYDASEYSPSAIPANPITTPAQLYQFMCYVNGVNGYISPTPNPGVEYSLGADINMSGYSHWVPIGEKVNADAPTVAFTGTFNGNGHVISGLTIDGSGDYTNYGLFGQTSGATIKDVFMQNVDFTKSSEDGTLGSIVGLMAGGTLSQCGASGSLKATDDGCVAGGLVGSMTSGTVHSSYATAELTGYQMGGLVGQLASGCNLFNSFANPKFTYSGTTQCVGGLVGVNSGTVENCYVRFSRASTGLVSEYFGQLAGNNSGGISASYTPYTYSGVPGNIAHGNPATSLTYKPVIAPYLYDHANDNTVLDSNLLDKLNYWVGNNSGSGYAEWKRTTAGGYSTNGGAITGGNINDDYPIHKMNDLACAASPDGLFIEYKYSLIQMLTKYNVLTGGTVWLYASPKNDDGSDEQVNVNNAATVKLYIDEGASLLQTAGNSLSVYTSQTIPGDPRSWHFLSSSLSNSVIGFDYGQTALFNWDPNPCNVTISANDEESLFPSDLPKVGGYSDVSKIDLYCFYEPQYHWINLKRKSDSHWHQNAPTMPIVYTNETNLTPGKGYLVSVDQDQLLQNKGTLNNGNVELTNVTYTTDNAWTEVMGYNLLGNPYQSYLDFDKFIKYASNAALQLEDQSKGGSKATYAIYDAKLGGYVQYKAGSSRGSRALDGKIPPHQGFLVRRTGGNASVSAYFTNDMRCNDGSGSFRGEQPAFPLINLIVTDGEGNSDLAVLELSRENNEGAEKLRSNTCKGWLYLHHNDENYAILFRDTVTDYQPLWFDASEAGTYTLRWETANVQFDELTLVDNITGTKTDMLRHDSYSFEADPDQYASRFKIVIGTFKPIHGVEESAEEETKAFAYVSNGMLVVNGEGQLDIVDMMGRTVKSEELHGIRSTVSMPQVSAGVYVLRLTNQNGTKTQKIVIE